MPFTIITRFSRLIHRRTRSEPVFETPAESDRPTRPQSLGNLDSLAQLSLANSSIAADRPVSDSFQLAAINQFIHDLTVQSEAQQAAIDTLKFEAELRQEELKVFRSDIDKERAVFSAERSKTKEYEDQARLRSRKLAEYEKYFDLIRSKDLGDILVSGPHRAISDGRDVDAALVSSIRAAAGRKGSRWSKLIPAVTGHRTSVEFEAAVSATMKAREEASDNAKRARFWKRLARDDVKNTELVTPSASNLSDVSQPALSPERQQAVDALLKKLRGTQAQVAETVAALPSIPSETSQLSEQSGIPSPEQNATPSIQETGCSLLPYLDSTLSQVSKLSEEPCLLPYLDSNLSSQTTAPKVPEERSTLPYLNSELSHLALKQEEVETVDQKETKSEDNPAETSLLAYLHPSSSQISRLNELVSTSSPSDSSIFSRPLAPLASQKFKEELIASHSSERFSLGNLLGNGEHNKRGSTILTASSSSGGDVPKPANNAEAEYSSDNPAGRDVFGPINNNIPSRPTIIKEDAQALQPAVDTSRTTILTENQSPPKKQKISKIPRRFYTSLSQSSKASAASSEPKSPPQSLLQPTISSSMKQTTSPPPKTKRKSVLKSVLSSRSTKKSGK